MAHFVKADPHFTVFFQDDKTVHIVANDKVVFGDNENVKVLWKTSNITEDGRTVVEDMPYEGVIIFSGSFIKCKTYKKMAEKEIDFAKDDVTSALISLGKEMKESAGKRGASIKLKRALQDESQTTKRPKKDAKQKTGKVTVKDLKLKEMAAFAGLASPTVLPSQKSLAEHMTPPKTKTPDHTHKTKTPDRTPKTKTPERTHKPKTPERTHKTKTPERTHKTKTPERTHKTKTPERTHKTKTPECTQKTKTPGIVAAKKRTPQKALDISSIVGESLGVLNDFEVSEPLPFLPEDEDQNNFAAIDPLPGSSTPIASQSGQHGFNMPSISFPQSGEGHHGPLHSIIEYYQRLSIDGKKHILGFCQMLTSAIHEDIYGSAGTAHVHDQQTDIGQSVSNSEVHRSSSFLEQNQERRVPLLSDEDGIYKDVLVNPTKLRAIEMKAMTSKKPEVVLLNKITELLFTKEELIASHGVKGLNDHKLDALKEFMYARCNSLHIQQIQPKVLMTTLQNKIGNLRKNEKSTCKHAKLSTLS